MDVESLLIVHLAVCSLTASVYWKSWNTKYIPVLVHVQLSIPQWAVLSIG